MTTTNPFHQDLAHLSDDELLTEVTRTAASIDVMYTVQHVPALRARYDELNKLQVHLEDECNLRGLYDHI